MLLSGVYVCCSVVLVELDRDPDEEAVDCNGREQQREQDGVVKAIRYVKHRPARIARSRTCALQPKKKACVACIQQRKKNERHSWCA